MKTEAYIESIIRRTLAEGYGKDVQAVIDRLKKVTLDYKMDNAISDLLNKKMISKLGSSNRSVYAIGTDYVLKVNNPNAVYSGQNKVEAKPKSVAIWGDWAPRVVARGTKFRWIISERVITSKSDYKWVKAAGLSRFGLSMYDVNVVMSAIAGDMKFKIYDGYIEPISESLMVEYIQMPYHTWQKGKEDPLYGKKNRNGFVRILISNLSKIEFKSMEQIDQFIQDFVQNDFVRRAIRAHQEIGARFGDYQQQNLGFTFDGRPVVLDTGF